MTVGLLSLGGNANSSRVTINANNISYLNLVKSFGFPTTSDPTTVSADGYPLSTPASAITAGSSPSMPSGYYGTFTWSWTGTAGMAIGGNPPTVFSSISPQGAVFEAGNVTSGDMAPGNMTVASQIVANNVANPTLVFAFGWNIQSIDSNAGVIRINTKVNFVASGSGYTIANNTVNITGANVNTGANGTWTITNKTASSFDLVGSTFTNAQAGVAGQAIFAASNLSISIRNGGTFTSFANLVWARTADIAAINAGQIISQSYIDELKYLFNQTGSSGASAGWIRFMDATGVQGSFEGDFSQRTPATRISYNSTNVTSGYWAAGGITNGGSDNYTCVDPSVSVLNGGGGYLDNATVQGIPSATNSGNAPTLAVGTGPAKKIIANGAFPGPAPIVFKCTVPPTTPGTDVLQFTFTATWLNSGTPYVLSYTTVAGDTTTGAVNASVVAKIGADATLSAAGIIPGNSGTPTVVPRTAQAGALTMAYTSGTASITVGNFYANGITSGSVQTFTYNYLLDCWLYRSGGATTSIPFEAIVDMCNRANANCWFNLGFTKAAFITSLVQFFGDSVTGLTSGLKWGSETQNEIWNPGAFPWALLQTLGNCLGWGNGSFVSNFSYVGLRTLQYAALAKTAWVGKGRNASDFYVFQMHQLGEALNGNFHTSQLKGASLVTSNAIYNTYGALNGTGTAVANYNAFPNRPGDITTAIGQAPYWNSRYLGINSFTDATQVSGTTAQNLSTLVAANNFANGLVSAAFAALVNQFNRVGTVGPHSGADFVDMQTFFTNDENICAQDDAARIGAGIAKLAVMHYEGGPSFGIGNNGNSGVNSTTFNTVATVDITALAGRITALSWDVSTWTLSGTNNATEMATMILQMLQGWKFDVDNNGVAFNSGSFKNMIEASYYRALKTTSGANRETKPCQYGVAASNWGFWSNSILDPNPYQNRLAIHEWNAGG